MIFSREGGNCFNLVHQRVAIFLFCFCMLNLCVLSYQNTFFKLKNMTKYGYIQNLIKIGSCGARNRYIHIKFDIVILSNQIIFFILHTCKTVNTPTYDNVSYALSITNFFFFFLMVWLILQNTYSLCFFQMSLK